MSWPQAKLEDVISFIRGVTFKPDDQGEPLSHGSTVVMRTKNVQVAGLDQSDLIAIPSELVKRKEQFLREGDILISSANSWELVGKASYVPQLDYQATAGGFISIVRANKSVVDSRYLYHWIASPSSQHKIRHCGRQTTNISNLDVGRFKDLEIPLPPLNEQKRIAAILDKADAIRRKHQQAIQLADEFLRAVFLDMFGDPVTNPKGWDVDYLPNLGAFKNGLNYGREDSGTSLHCLGVGDFKALDRIEGVGSLSEIQLNSEPAKEYYLKDGDLVFVRSNGNKVLVGRCIAVYPGAEKLTFSGFCIRFRPRSENINTDYLNYLFRMPSIKHEMLKGGEGANIQNINQKKLSEIAVPIPPKELLQRFKKIVAKFKKIQSQVHLDSAETTNLFASISQKAFSGEL